LEQRLGVLGGVLAVRDLDVGHLLGGRAVVVHVAHEGEGEVLAGAAHAERHLGEVEASHRLGGPGAGAPDAELGVAVHRAVNRDGLAHPGLDGAHGEADQRLGGRAAAHDVHVEVRADAEVGRDVGRQRGVAPLVVEHPVHVLRRETGVEDRLADRLDGHGAGRAPRSARVLRLAHAHDAVFVPEVAHRRSLEAVIVPAEYNAAAAHAGARAAGIRGGRQAPSSAAARRLNPAARANALAELPVASKMAPAARGPQAAVEPASMNRNPTSEPASAWPKKSPTMEENSVVIVPYEKPNTNAVAYSAGRSWAAVNAVKATACTSIENISVGRRPTRSETRPSTNRPKAGRAPLRLPATS